MTTAQQTLKPITRPSRMTLSSVLKGKIEVPLRELIYGTEGIGKTTFASEAPSPIFLGAEEGTEHLDVARFPKPETMGDVYEAIRVLGTEAHEYQTLVIDTVDWLEPIIWREVCSVEKLTSIEDFGYGKGYVKAVDEWRKLLAHLERLQAAKRMHLLLLAHSQIRPYRNPEGEDYDRYSLKVNDKAAGLLKEWVHSVLFAKHETLAHKDTRTKRVRGVSTGARLLCTERAAAFDAKNRYSLPPELPLSWADFQAAVQAGKPAEPSDLRAEITRKAAELGGDIEKAALSALKAAADNVQHLAIINNRLNARLAEKAAATEQANEAGKQA